MIFGLTEEQAYNFRFLDREVQERLIAGMSALDLLKMDAAFELWINSGQRPPSSEGWNTWLMMAGRGFGKTRAGAEWVIGLATARRETRIALVGATMDEARRVMVEGPSGVLTLCRKRDLKAKWEPSRGEITFRNGSVMTLYSADSPESLRGPEHHFAWADELGKWRRAAEAWANLEMGLRKGPRSRALITTTPRTMPLIEQVRGRPSTIETNGRTSDNVTLSKNYIDLMIATYGGTRWGRQELDGEYFNEADGSLFPRDLMERARCARAEAYDRIVVGVDPPASEHGDACGIVVAGRVDNDIHVLADASIPKCSPSRWARQVAMTAELWGASHVVAEANQGGDMVKDVLRGAGLTLRVHLVHASKGKAARAEPIAVRMENGLVKLAGIFPDMEAELAGLQVAGGYDGSGSPDRADAMVWAVTELSDLKSGVPRVRWL